VVRARCARVPDLSSGHEGDAACRSLRARGAMSNCIEISGRVLKTFSDSEIDIAALKALIESVQDLPSAPKSGDEYLAWWFLTSQCHDSTWFSESGSYVTIPFGQCRSTHTWRDFRGTLSLLAKYARKPIKITFMLRDVDWDNNSKPGPLVVRLTPGGQVDFVE